MRQFMASLSLLFKKVPSIFIVGVGTVASYHAQGPVLVGVLIVSWVAAGVSLIQFPAFIKEFDRRKAEEQKRLKEKEDQEDSTKL